MGVVSEHTHTLDGVTYTCTTFPAAEGLEILPRLLSLFGGRVVQLALQAGEEGLEHMMSQPEVLSAIITEAAKAGADNPDGWSVLKDLLVHTTADKVRIGDNEIAGSVHAHFDSHFTGRLMHLIKVSVWVATKSF